MSETNAIDNYHDEVEIIYRGEKYRVRDNGSLLRLPRHNKDLRHIDNQWTFGNIDLHGYMRIGKELVHRIVATAFHNEPPSDKHVVDHIDTNRTNNRADNLRWLTREENLYDNPITKQRIEKIWGSIQSMLNYFRSSIPEEISISKDSLTPRALQKSWKVPCEFPMCPDDILQENDNNFDQETYAQNQLNIYMERLEFGSEFSRNIYGSSITVTVDSTEDCQALSVVTNLANNGIKDWGVAKITFENCNFVHESISTFFTLQGALKCHCKILGIPLDKSFDDYA